MSLLDAAFHIGVESAYGTPVALSRSFETQVDGWVREHEQIESVGLRADNQAVRDDRRHQIMQGGTGRVELDFLNAGMGLLMQGLLGSSAVAQDGATTAWDHTLTSTDSLSVVSLTTQIERAFADDSGQSEMTHEGVKATAWSLDQPAGGALKLGIDYDFENVLTATAAATAAYPALATSFFDWTMCAVSIDGSSFEEVTSLEFSADLKAKIDRRYLRANEFKAEPVVTGLPVYSLQIDSDFVKEEFYDDFVAGNIVPIIVTWTFADANAIESGKTHTITLNLDACQFDGSSPDLSLTDTTKQSLPLMALYDGTNPAAELIVKSADIAL